MNVDSELPGALQAHDVTVRFAGLVALDAVSLAVPPNQVTGVIGPNGAGKTTLLNVLCGFVRPQTGTVRWDGRELTRIRPHQLARLRIGRTLQGLGLFAGMTALDNVMVGAAGARIGFTASLFGLPRTDRAEAALRERALAALDELGAVRGADRLPAQLSYGMRKRVALARALVAEPKLLMLDEPASGLSEAELHELGELIGRLRERMAVVVVEHHMDLVMSVCDTVVVLDFGKVIAAGGPDEVRADEAVNVAYLGAEVAP